MTMLQKILLLLFFFQGIMYAGEIKHRADLKDFASQLIVDRDFQKFSKTVKQYLENKERLPGGRWKVFYIYQGVYRAYDIHNKNETYWDDNERALKTSIKDHPNDPGRQIAYAIFLIKKAWMYRGTSYARHVNKADWQLFRAEVKKAIDYLVVHKKVASKDPNWYVVMLDLAKLNGWNKSLFSILLNEALDRYPNYYPIYQYALTYMQPKWNNFTNQEIEDVARSVMRHNPHDKEGVYARFYWMAADIIFDRRSLSDSNIDWETMDESIKKLLAAYPTKYNINGIAYLACKANQEKIMRKYITQIEGKPILSIWRTQENFDICNNLSKNNNTTNITTINPDKVIDYIENYKDDKPLFIYFSSYTKSDMLKGLNNVEKLVKEYKNKINFLSVNFASGELYAYPSIYKKFYLTKLPSSIIVYKKKIILRLDVDPSLEQYMFGIFQRNINALLEEMKYTNFFRYFKEDILDESSFLNTEENIRINIQDYLNSTSKYKALAVASNIKKDIWALGRSLHADSQHAANEKALKECEKEKLNYNMTRECKLFMIGRKYVYEKNNSFILKK